MMSGMPRLAARALLLFAAATAWAATADVATSPAYPNRPIKLIVTFPPGGGTDLIARLLAQKMTDSMGQPVLVENKGGAGGTIGTEFVAKSPADGYTILFVAPPFVMAPALYPKLGFDPVKDFAPITLIGSVPMMLVANRALGVHNLTELIALGKTKPDALAAVSLGSASTQGLAAAQFAAMAKVNILLVPYKGSAPGMNDLLAGHIPLMFNALPSTLPHAKSGELIALGVSSTKRSALAPQVPAINEVLPGYEIVTWYGILAPAGTPQPIVQRLHEELARAGNLPDVKAKLLDLGMELQFSRPDEFSALIKSELVKWAEVIRQTGVKAD